MVELRLEVLFEPERTGESVSEVCRRWGISRQTFYEYRRRYEAEGPAGLESRSRRPTRSPGRIDPEMEAEICRLRKDHPRWGARRIRAELLWAGMDSPVVSTIHQTLRRNFLVADQPKKRPKASRRFEREAPNDLWQIDATRVLLADDTERWVVTLLDDHARFLLAARASEAATTEAAWVCFAEATMRYALPRQLLSDNGLCFTGHRAGFEVVFELRVRELGVELIHSRPYHPQTLGKLERFHRTLKEWLADQSPAGDLEHLQQLLDEFRRDYNQERPHQGIGDRTPAERFFADPLAGVPPGEDLHSPAYPLFALTRQVSSNGSISFRYKRITLGRRWAGAHVRVIEAGALVHIYYGRTLLRSLAVNGQGQARYPMGSRPGRRSMPTSR